jgi:predicted permease
MFRRFRKRNDFSEEIEAHLQLEADRLKEEGLSENEALLAARRAFGNSTRAQERFYESRRWLLVEECWRDIRFGWRLLAKNPGSTILAILALALGIGINTAIFSVLNIALLKFLPVRDPKELVMLTDPNASEVLGGFLAGAQSLLTYPEFAAIRDHTTSMSGLCASQMMLQRWPVHVSGGAQEEAHGRLVSENYFSVFGVEPAAGRLLKQQDATGVGKDPYVVISYDYWQRRFGGNPAVIGTPIRFYRTTLTVIGVAVKGFRGETVGQDPDVWLPMLMEPLVIPGGAGFHEYMDKAHDKLMWLHVFGRRRPGVTVAQVEAEVNVLFQDILKAGKESLKQSIVVKPVRIGAFHGRDEFSEQWIVLSVLAALVLFIACANVANLLLARATARSREVAIRLSIGAGKARLVRQFLTESLLLAGLGGIAGLFVAVGALHLLVLALSQSDDHLNLAVGIDIGVLAFTAFATLLTGILFGLAPALRSTRMKETSGQRLILSKALVMVQFVLSFLLVLGAGLFLRTLWNLQAVSLGYPAENLLLVKVDSLGVNGLAVHNDAKLSHELAERIRRIPGVRGVSYSERGLFTGFDGARLVWVEGFTSHGDEDIGSAFDFVGPGYFSTVGIPLLSGREFSLQDMANAAPRVCIINEAFARHFFPGGNPLGKRVTTTIFDDQNPAGSRVTFVVIGVAKNARVRSLRSAVDPKMYTPSGGSSFEIRTATEPLHLVNEVRKAILPVNEDLAIQNSRTLTQLVEEQNAQPRLIAQLCTLFGIIALILAATGIYGVLSYSVARRTNEIGIRMALGAGKPVVTGMILQETAWMIAIGMVGGLATAAALARVTAALLYGTGPAGSRWSLARYQEVESATQLFGLRAMDPLTIAAAIGMLCMVGLMAAYLPAARAARVDPMNALRHD